jgi:hypothetical protein
MSVRGTENENVGPHGRLSARQLIVVGLLHAVCLTALAAGVLAPTGRAGGGGSTILVAYRSGTSLFVKSLGGGAAARFASDRGGQQMAYPALSPDGRRVLWIALGGAETPGPTSQKIYLATVDGSRPRVIAASDSYKFASVHFASNGSVVMVEDVGDNRLAVFFSAHPESGFREVKSSVGLVGGNAELSPDSRSVAFDAKRGIAVASTVKTLSKPRVVLLPPSKNVGIELLEWSRDDRLIYASSCSPITVTTTTCIYSATARGGDRRKLATLAVEKFLPPSFSVGADGRTVAYSGCGPYPRGCGVWVVSSPRARPVEIARTDYTTWGVSTATHG